MPRRFAATEFPTNEQSTRYIAEKIDIPEADRLRKIGSQIEGGLKWDEAGRLLVVWVVPYIRTARDIIPETYSRRSRPRLHQYRS